MASRITTLMGAAALALGCTSLSPVFAQTSGTAVEQATPASKMSADKHTSARMHPMHHRAMHPNAAMSRKGGAQSVQAQDAGTDRLNAQSLQAAQSNTAYTPGAGAASTQGGMGMNGSMGTRMGNGMRGAANGAMQSGMSGGSMRSGAMQGGMSGAMGNSASTGTGGAGMGNASSSMNSGSGTMSSGTMNSGTAGTMGTTGSGTMSSGTGTMGTGTTGTAHP